MDVSAFPSMLEAAGIKVNYARFFPLMGLMNLRSVDFTVDHANLVINALGIDLSDDPRLAEEIASTIRASDADSISVVLSEERYLVPLVRRLFQSRDRRADRLIEKDEFVPVLCNSCQRMFEVSRTIAVGLQPDVKITARCLECNATKPLLAGHIRYFGV